MDVRFETRQGALVCVAMVADCESVVEIRPHVSPQGDACVLLVPTDALAGETSAMQFGSPEVVRAAAASMALKASSEKALDRWRRERVTEHRERATAEANALCAAILDLE